MVTVSELGVAIDAWGDDLTLLEAEVHEAIDHPTRAEIRFHVPRDLDLTSGLGSPATLTLTQDDDVLHRYHLMVVEAELTDIVDALGPRPAFHYRAVLEVELTLLRQRRNVRMFQDMDAEAIIRKVLDDAGIPAGHVAITIQRALPKRAYCVQYRETDFDFISRLMEEEGIFYFSIDGDDVSLTIADAQSAFEAIKGDSAIAVARGHGTGIGDLSFESGFVPEVVAVNDYNFRTPSTSIEGKHTRDGGNGELFAYPGRHGTADEGNLRAQIIADALYSHAMVGTAASNALAARAGAWFDLEGARRSALDDKYLIIEVTLWLRDGEIRNRFRFVPHERTYRPLPKTPQPRLRGLHSAVVTGPSGSEIHVDDLGQMKAKFFWDAVGADDDTSSFWMRVAQLPIGGSMALARVGWEMGIAYVDGDPDRPVAISRLYNAEKVAPYGYPAAGSRMALQTPTSPGGGSSNEIRMEDSGGSQEMFINSTKDMVEQINNNRTRSVGVDHTVDVAANVNAAVTTDQTVDIGGSKTITVGDAESVSVTGDRTKTVGASETVTVSGGVEVIVEGADSETVGGSHTTLAAMAVERQTAASQTLTVGGSMIQAAILEVGSVTAGARSETVGGAKICASADSVSETVVGACATTVGGAMIQAAAGKRVGGTSGSTALTVGGLVNANAASKLTLKAKKIDILVGGVANFIGGGGILTLTPASASFTGLVTIDASGSVKISGNPNLMT